MNLLQVVLLAFVASTFASPIALKTAEINYPVVAVDTKGVFDFVINTFGLSEVWSQIQDLGAITVAKLVNVLTQILFRGTTAIGKAKDIISILVKELTNHTVGTSQAVFQAISDLTAILAGNTDSRIYQRGVIDFLIDSFGLNGVWDQIQALGANTVAKFVTVLTSLMFKGQSALNAARPIIATLIQRLKDHSVGSSQAVFQAISDMTAILGGSA